MSNEVVTNLDDDEITVSMLLDKFGLDLDLSSHLFEKVISSDFLKADYSKKKKIHIFKSDDVVLSINPSDKNETIKYLLVIDGEVNGGFILGYDSMQYLN